MELWMSDHQDGRIFHPDGDQRCRTVLDPEAHMQHMLHELVDVPDDCSVASLHAAYLSELARRIESMGIETITAETDIDNETLEAITSQDAVDLRVLEAAKILAVDDKYPDADTIAAVSRDALLLSMSNAVVDVETLSSELDGELEPREIQSKVEGRFPMTIREFALLYGHLQCKIQ